MTSFLKNIWLLLAHLPPLIVVIPYQVLFFVWKWFTTLLEVFGYYTFKLQHFLTPECCRTKIVRVDNPDNRG